MSFDIPQIHLADNSPEAQAVEQVMGRDHVGPKEAVLSILRNSIAKKNPAQRMIGLLAEDDRARATESVERWHRLAKAFPHTAVLSDDAVSRETMYGEGL